MCVLISYKSSISFRGNSFFFFFFEIQQILQFNFYMKLYTWRSYYEKFSTFPCKRFCQDIIYHFLKSSLLTVDCSLIEVFSIECRFVFRMVNEIASALRWCRSICRGKVTFIIFVCLFLLLYYLLVLFYQFFEILHVIYTEGVYHFHCTKWYHCIHFSLVEFFVPWRMKNACNIQPLLYV